MADSVKRDVLPDARPAARRCDHIRGQGPRHEVPADHAAPSARWGAERAHRAHRRRRLRRLERLRRAVQHAEFRATRGRRAEVHPLPHDRPVLADARRTAQRPEPPLGRDGRHHRDRDIGARLQLGATEEQGARRGNPQAQWLLDGAVRQMPRGACVGDEPDGAVRRLAHRQRLRALLRLHRRRDEPVRPGDLPRHRADRAGGRPGGGLPLHRGHDRSRHRVDPAAEGADGGQAVLRLLRARRDARAAPRSAGVVRQVQGQVRRRLGCSARAELCSPEGARRHPGRCGADRATGGDPGLG